MKNKKAKNHRSKLCAISKSSMLYLVNSPGPKDLVINVYRASNTIKKRIHPPMMTIGLAQLSELYTLITIRIVK
jgi:hypothetical protein